MDKTVSKLKVDFFKTTCGAFFASKEFCDVLRSYNAEVQYVNADLENTLLLKPVISSRLKQSFEKANLIIDILEFNNLIE